MNKYRPFFISAFLAGIAVLLAYLYLNDKEQLLVDQSTATQVVVATQDINSMAVIDSNMLKLDQVPKRYIQPGAQSDIKSIEGMIAAVPIKQGEQIVDTKLLFPGEESGLSQRISSGRRGVTIPVTDVHGVGKLVRPGDRVDILASIDYGVDEKEEREVKTIMQDVLVLATGKYVADSLPRAIASDYAGNETTVDLRKEDYQTVTVELDPIEAQGLIFLLTSGQGDVFLALRNPDDRSRYKLYTTDSERLLGPRSKLGLKRAAEQNRRGPRWLEIRDSSAVGVY